MYECIIKCNTKYKIQLATLITFEDKSLIFLSILYFHIALKSMTKYLKRYLFKDISIFDSKENFFVQYKIYNA